MKLQANNIFDSHYTLIRQLGRGGFSEVWLAHDSYMDLDVALKIYAPGMGMDKNSIDDFRHEIKAVFSLNHPNLLTPRYLGVFNDMPYLVLPFCEKGSVTHYIGKLDEQHIQALLHDVAAGLAYLHSKDIIHQDIKPDNILIDDNGNYLITDFGISAKARNTLRKSVMSNAAGTMSYMPPERFSAHPTPIKASDIWALGAMTYELITGDVPFGDLGGTAQKAGADIPEIEQPISEQLRSAVKNMLNKDPWARPTAEQLIQAAPSTHHYVNQVPDTETIPLDSFTTERLTQPMVQNEALSVSEESISVVSKANTQRVEVNSTLPWEATCDATWLYCEKVSDTELRIHCNRNFWGYRYARVIISNANEQKSILISQDKNSIIAFFFTLVCLSFVAFLIKLFIDWVTMPYGY